MSKLSLEKTISGGVEGCAGHSSFTTKISQAQMDDLLVSSFCMVTLYASSFVMKAY